ncbi:hypothetical protein NPIL_309391, partial [Nephila pilipes]
MLPPVLGLQLCVAAGKSAKGTAAFMAICAKGKAFAGRYGCCICKAAAFADVLYDGK